MAEFARTSFHLILLSVLVAGLWVYADAKARMANPKATWFDSTGKMHTGDPYGPIDPTLLQIAVAQADLYEELGD